MEGWLQGFNFMSFQQGNLQNFDAVINCNLSTNSVWP